MKRSILVATILLAAGQIAFAQPDGAQVNTILTAAPTVRPVFSSSTQTILQSLQENGHFTVLTGLISKAKVQELITGRSSVTLFAPTDDAFAKMGDAAVQALSNDPKRLKQFIMSHVVSGRLILHDLFRKALAKKANFTAPATMTVASAAGTKLNLMLNPPVTDANALHPILNGAAHVVESDIVSRKAVIQVLDAVDGM